MKKLLTLITMLTVGFGYQLCHDATDWCYDVSTAQAFYMFATATVDGELADYESGDASVVIGAFCDGEMVGFVYAALEYSTVPAMGNDGNFPAYCTPPNPVSGDPGTTPTFKIYDASNDAVIDASCADPIPSWDTNAINVLGELSITNVDGCKDDTACNYNADATADDGSCYYPSGCDNACGSDLVLDACGVCGGDGSDDQGCGCFEPAPSGCDDTCRSTLEFDNCDVCGGDDSSCTGCTDPIADNYDAGNSIEDGSCAYTVPAVGDLNAEDGPERAILSWSAPAQMGDASYSYDVISGGEVVKADLVGTSTQVLNLLPDVEACFTVVAKKFLWCICSF